MNLKKVLMLALLGSALVSRVDAFTDEEIVKSPRPKKVRPVLDEHGKKIEGLLDAYHEGKWMRFEKSEYTCAAREGKRPKYQYATPICAALDVVEKDGTCMLYYRTTETSPSELSPEEKETIMLEEVFED